MTRSEDIESFLDAGPGSRLVAQQLSDNELELLWVARGQGRDLSVVVLDRTTVPDAGVIRYTIH